MSKKSHSVIPATRQRVRTRTQELARQAGRVPPQVNQADYERAKRDITGETDGDRQDAMLDAGERRLRYREKRRRTFPPG